MAEFPLIVSYYTKDTVYQLEIQNLIASLELWGLEYHIDPIPSFGSWESNCCFKPFFLLEKLKQFDRPIFWVDADAVIVKKPEYLEVFKSDFSVRINEDLENNHPSKMISGSIYVNTTLNAEKLLKSWAQESIRRFSDPKRACELWDQEILRDVIFQLAQGDDKIHVEPLPLSYQTIFDHPIDSQQIEEAVIVHYQASRRFKKIINDDGKVSDEKIFISP